MANEDVENEETEETKGGSKTLIIVVMILLVLVLVIGGLVAFFVLGSDEEMLEGNPQESMQKQQHQKRNRAKDSNFLTIGPIYPMDNFIVNLVSNGGKRYLKTSMEVELSDEEMSLELDSKKPLIRDIIIRILSSKTFEEISTKKGKTNLKEELVEQLNEVLADGYLKNIFLTSFVIQ